MTRRRRPRLGHPIYCTCGTWVIEVDRDAYPVGYNGPQARLQNVQADTMFGPPPLFLPFECPSCRTSLPWQPRPLANE